MRLVFNRRFHQRETKIGIVNASAIYGLQLLVRVPDLHSKVIGGCSSLRDTFCHLYMTAY